MIRLGFTGTRRGCTSQQLAALKSLLLEHEPSEFHHGLCEGADAQAHTMTRTLFGRQVRIIGHPGPADDPYQIVSLYEDCDELLPHKGHFARNRDIVAACDVLLGTPGEMTHQSRGGTWMTIDHAVKAGRPVRVIYPDGTVEDR